MMGFDMGVGKGKIAAEVVIDAGPIDPCGWRLHVHSECSVVDADGVFVNEDPQPGRPWPRHVGKSAISQPAVALHVDAGPVKPGSVYGTRRGIRISSYRLIHGNCPRVRSVVGRTLVN